MSRKFDNSSGNYAVITGASSGIGKCLSLCLAKEGFDTVLIARREDRLHSLADLIRERYDRESVVITADLSAEKECLELAERLSGISYSVLVNCAGFGDCGAFTETDLSKDLAMIDVNIRALHILTKSALRDLTERGSGYILNVASSAGLMPAGPYMSVYYATKAYVTSLTSAIERELKESNSSVYIGMLCPGPVDTEFNDIANVRFSLKGISPEECASYAIRKMKQKKTLIVPELSLRLAFFFGRFIPRRFYVRLVGLQQSRKLGR